MFDIFDISTFVAQRPESLGSKEKRWIVPEEGFPLPSRPHLFKMGRPNTGENWSEKAACEIAKLFGLPTANYEFAVAGGDRGVISEQLFPEGGRLMLGNLLLSKIERGYDGAKRFGLVQYRLSTVLRLLGNLNLAPPLGFENPPMHPTAYFVGYLIFDALIGNTDRHHENWGVVIDYTSGEPKFHLAPTFDHASSLGRNETDEKRRFRLNTPDPRGSVEAYASRAKSAFFGRGKVTLTMREVMAELARTHPTAAAFWAGRIADMTQADFASVFEQISPEWISTEAVAFALRMLACNQRMIEEEILAR